MEGLILGPNGHSFFGKIGPGLKLCGEVSKALCEEATRQLLLVHAFSQTYVHAYFVTTHFIHRSISKLDSVDENWLFR